MYDLEAIKQRFSLKEYISNKYGEPLDEGWGRSTWNCPLPDHEDRNASFIVDEQDRFYCFGCGKGGDIFDFLELTKGLSLYHAAKYLSGEDHLPQINEGWQFARSIEQTEERERKLQEKINATEKALAKLRRTKAWLYYMRYLSERKDMQKLWAREGLPRYWQHKFMLGCHPWFYAGESLTIPVITPFEEEPVNIRHRIIGRNDDKYRPEIPDLPPSFFWANPEMGITDEIFLVEGEKKAMVLWRFLFQFGFTHRQVVAILGKNGLQQELLTQFGNVDRVHFIPDPDLTPETISRIIMMIGKPTRVQRYDMKIDDALLCGRISANDIIMQ